MRNLDREAADTETILDARAKALAQPLDDRARLSPYVVAVVGNQRLAMEASRARHVSTARPVTAVPSHVEAVAGVVPLHGTVVAAVDLAAVLGVVAERPVTDRQLVVVDDGDEGVALLVDDVEGLAELDDASFDGPDTTITELTAPGPGGIRLLHVDAVLSSLSSSPTPAHQTLGGDP